MSGFKGKYDHAVDSKGRIIIPSKLKKHLSPEADEKFVITRGLDDVLWLYPLDVWNAWEQQLKENTNPFNSEDRFFVRTLMQYAHEVQLDKQNRIMIPKELLDLAHITSAVKLLGMFDYIEIWSPEEFDRYFSSTEQSYEQVASRVMGQK